MPEADREKLVQKTMTAKEFVELFPWKDIGKFYFLFLIYTLVAGVVFFSTEQCLSEHNQHISKSGNIRQRPVVKEKVNCSVETIHIRGGIHKHPPGEETKPNDVINVKKCPPVKNTNEEKNAKKCNLMEWKAKYLTNTSVSN